LDGIRFVTLATLLSRVCPLLTMHRSEVRGSDPTLFTNSTPNTVHVDHQKSTPAGNCFIAGTKVATDKGEISIEDITEGTRILTEATAGRYGIASDEDVVTPPGEGKTMLVGFSTSRPENR
jgi:hypothetical protein